MSENCPCDCNECFILGDSVPDWAQRKVCKKLDELREQCWEDEGGAVKKEEEDEGGAVKKEEEDEGGAVKKEEEDD